MTNVDRLVEAREKFDKLVDVQRTWRAERSFALTLASLRTIVELGRILGVDEQDLAVFAYYEPSQVTPVGNMHDLLAHVCLPKDDE